MSRGYYVPCAPFLYLVPDSGGGGMDCMPLQPAHAHQPHRPPGPFQYLMHEQAKSLVALQELQNEVGALLEFRDLVMETFPHLRHKLAASERGGGGSSSSCCTSTASSTAATLPHAAPAASAAAAHASPSGAASRHRLPAADWEPGVRVRRKLLPHKEITGGGDGAPGGTSHRKQPKSGDGSGTSSAGSSAVQDSGFGTETSSSKAASATTVLPPAHHHQAGSSSVVVDEAEDELWNLLDVIQRKGTRLRDEVAQLQQRLAGSTGAPAAPEPRQRPAQPPPPRRPLGALDAVLGAPAARPGARPDAAKVAAILREFDPLELQRHLLNTTAHNQALQHRLEKTAKLHTSLLEQLDKVKDENDDLRFQLAEKSIELEGTRARMRILQQRQSKAAETTVSTETDDEQPPLLPPEETCNPILPLLALPVASSDDHNHQHHSSSTESAHDHTEQRRVQSSNSPRRRPSKIPLLGTKSYCAPRPPSGKSGAVTAAQSNKSKDSLSAKSGRESSWKSKADGASLSGSKSREPISVVRNTSLSVRNNSRESLNGSKSRDSILSKSRSDSVNGRKVSTVEVTMVSARSRDGHSQNSFSSNASNTNKRDSLSGKSREASFSSSSGWKGTQHPVRRASSVSITRGSVVDQADRNSKVITASDSLEPKQCSSATGETHGSHHDDHHDADSFSDSLNHFPDQEVELSPKTSDEIDFKSLTSQANLHSQGVNCGSNIVLDVNSSSSEFFDSINDSESVLNNEIVCSKNVLIQDHHLHTSSRYEGLTECDSLENRAPEMMIEAFHTPTKFLSKVISTRNFCIAPGGQHTEY